MARRTSATSASIQHATIHAPTHLPNLTATATTYHKNKPTAMAAAGGGEPLAATLSRAIDASLQGDKQAQAFLEGLSTPDLSSVSGLTRSTFRIDHCCRRRHRSSSVRSHPPSHHRPGPRRRCCRSGRPPCSSSGPAAGGVRARTPTSPPASSAGKLVVVIDDPAHGNDCIVSTPTNDPRPPATSGSSGRSCP